MIALGSCSTPLQGPLEVMPLLFHRNPMRISNLKSKALTRIGADNFQGHTGDLLVPDSLFQQNLHQQLNLF